MHLIEGAPNVTLAMAFEGHVSPAALVSYAELVFRSSKAGVLGTVVFGDGGVADRVKNEIVAEALERHAGMTHLMWVEPNLVVPPDAMSTLLRHEKDVVGGIYPRRLEQSGGVVYLLDPFRWIKAPITEARRVDGLGLGCTLVSAHVFRDMSIRHGDETWHKRFYGRSEDVFFFQRCRELGVEVYVDPAVECLSATASELASTATIEDDVEGDVEDEGDSEPRVAIAVPLFEAISPLAMMNLIALIRNTVASGLVRGIFFTNGLFYDVARNTLVRAVLDSAQRFTHILWIDSDMVVPPDSLNRLLATNEPIVGGLYHTKRGDLHPAVFTVDPVVAVEMPGSGLTQVDGFGLGCALVQRTVYEEMASTYRDERWHEFSYGAGEDTFFFKRCKRMGVPVWLDTDLRCGHVVDYAVTTADWDALRASGVDRSAMSWTIS